LRIAIASGKGGTGKTTLATNLVRYLSDNHEVILADLDVEEPNSGLFIQGKLVNAEDKFKMVPNWEKEECILCGHCQKICNFHSIIKLGEKIMIFPELCHSCFACSELCPSKSLPMIPVKMGKLKHFETERFSFIESKLDIGQEQAVPLISQTIKYIESHFDKNTIVLFDSPPGKSAICMIFSLSKKE